jgi:hypothetical protein
MAAKRQARILFEPEEYQKLEILARQQGTTVPDLIRKAVRDRYVLSMADRKRALEEILRLEIPMDPMEDWTTLEEEIERSHVDGIS